MHVVPEIEKVVLIRFGEAVARSASPRLKCLVCQLLIVSDCFLNRYLELKLVVLCEDDR